MGQFMWHFVESVLLSQFLECWELLERIRSEVQFQIWLRENRNLIRIVLKHKDKGKGGALVKVWGICIIA